MKTRIYQLPLMCILTLLIGACASTDKLLDNGNYEELIYLAQKRLSGKKKKKEKYVLALEEAFRRIQQVDMSRINRLKTSDRPEDWEAIYRTAERIEKRQDVLQPFLPIVARHGYKANFEFIRTEVIIDNAHDKITSLYYNRAELLLSQAERGNKASARDAYYDYQSVSKYDRLFRDVREKMQSARKLGIVRVQVKIDNRSNMYLPNDLDEELLSLDFKKLNRNWVTFYTSEEEFTEMDYLAHVQIHQIRVTPDAIHEHDIVKTKEVEEGWEYVLDENGNVAKDSLGNDIKQPRFIIVKAHLLETQQEKRATIRGKLKLYNKRTESLEESEPFQVVAKFKHKARTFSGDIRALDKNEAKVIPPVPFPTKLDMIFMVSEELKPELLREIERFRLI